jgi:hypothetical protein
MKVTVTIKLLEENQCETLLIACTTHTPSSASYNMFTLRHDNGVSGGRNAVIKTLSRR